MSFNKQWTLFLDRDGVVNKRIIGGYVKGWKEFEFLEGVMEALDILSGIFGRIIIVSNQQGVGKGVMTLEEASRINERMVQQVSHSGGRIDRVYFSPHLDEEKHPDRKPGTGMALRAKAEFPGIDFQKSVMAGDSLSDMQFGRNIGAVNVLINPDQDEAVASEWYDHRFISLKEFAVSLNKTQNSKPKT